MVIETEQQCVLLNILKSYKHTVYHTHIYKLEMITKCVVNAVIPHVKIVHSVLVGL